MPAAINKYVFVSMSFNKDRKINIYSDQFDDKVSFSLDNLSGSKAWHKYVLGSIQEVFKSYNVSSGLNISIHSNLPMGKGVSSSAALEVALVNSLFEIFNIDKDDNEIIKICQKIDHKYIGIQSGVLDQSASQLSKVDNILKLDFNNGSFDYINSNFSGCTWIIVDSMIKRELAASKYHERVNECKEALAVISKLLNKKISFRDIKLDNLSLLDNPTLKNRIKHYIDENKRVIQMEDSIFNNDKESMGKILIQSHCSLRDLYEVSCKEIDYLFSVSSDFQYWYGGRIMGGGFGGSMINLVKDGYEEEYSNFIKGRYKKEFNIDADVFNVEFSNGVEVLA
jgi:galactokinase